MFVLDPEGVDRGEVDLGRRITLAEDQKRLGTGILRYLEAGANFSLRDAAWVMEAVSDNSATDICSRRPADR